MSQSNRLGLSGNDTPPVFVRPQPPCVSPPPPPDTPSEYLLEELADDMVEEEENAVFSDNPSAMETRENSENDEVDNS